MERAEQLHRALFEPVPPYGQLEALVGEHLFTPDWAFAAGFWASEHPRLHAQGETNFKAHWAQLDQEIRKSSPLTADPFLGAIGTLDTILRPAKARLYTHQEADLQARAELGLGDAPIRDGLKHRFQKRVTQLMEQENPLRRGRSPEAATRLDQWKQQQAEKWNRAAAELHRRVAIELVRGLDYQAYLANDWIPNPGENAHANPRALTVAELKDLSLVAVAPKTNPLLKQLKGQVIPGTANHPWEVWVSTPMGEKRIILRPRDFPGDITFGYKLESFQNLGVLGELRRPEKVFDQTSFESIAWFARARQTLEHLQSGLEILEEPHPAPVLRQKLQTLHQENQAPPEVMAHLQTEGNVMALLWAKGNPQDWIRERDRNNLQPPLQVKHPEFMEDASRARHASPSNTSRDALEAKQKRGVFEVHGAAAPTLFAVPSVEDRSRATEEWSPRSKKGSVQVESRRFFPVHGDRLGLILPEGMDLAQLEVWDTAGKTKVLGRDYTVQRIEGGRGFFLQCPTCDSVAYRASYTKTGAPRVDVPEDLSRLDKKVVSELAGELDKAGFTAVAKKLRSLLWWRKWGDRKVSVGDLARAFRSAARYSFVPETLGPSQADLPAPHNPDPRGRSVFEAYAGFLNSKGQMCAQCDGTNGLFASFLRELFRRSGLDYQTEVRTFYVRDGTTLSESLHAVTKVFGAKLLGLALDATPPRMDTRQVPEVKETAPFQEDPTLVRQAMLAREAPHRGNWATWLPELEPHRQATKKALASLFEALQSSGLREVLLRDKGPLSEWVEVARIIEKRLTGPLDFIEWRGQRLTPREFLDQVRDSVARARSTLEQHVPGRDKKFPVYADPHIRLALDELGLSLSNLATQPCRGSFDKLAP